MIAGYYALEESTGPGPFVPWIYWNPNRFGTNAAAPWNNDGNDYSSGTGIKISNLLDSVGVATTVDINCLTVPTTFAYGGPGNTGSNTGPFPDAVQERGLGSDNTFSIRLEQLAADTDYKFVFFGSLFNYHGSSNTYTVNGVAHTYSTLSNNKTNTLEVETTSDANGWITITVAKVAGTAKTTMCGFVLYKR